MNRRKEQIMLFRKKITPACAYCQWGTAIDDSQILCIKKGEQIVRPFVIVNFLFQIVFC